MERSAVAGAGMRLAMKMALVMGLCASQVQAQTHVLIVSGLGGDELHSARFHDWSTSMINAATSRFGIAETNIVYLAERVERDPERIAGRSTKENVENAFRSLASRARADDEILFLVIGHGSYQGEESRLSLPGPDMTPQDFEPLLDLFPTQTIAFVNTASASGEFVEALSGARRTIITATRSAFERNEAVFGRYFAEAFADDVADVDHDERLSVLEAFEYARQEVARYYEDDNRLLTEHAVLDDNGDGEGSDEPDPATSDGALAALFVFDATASTVAEIADDDPYLAGLYQQQRIYQDSLAVLRSRRDELESAAYDDVLERLLVRLSQVALAIRERGGAGL
jgi:hypothetical protein